MIKIILSETIADIIDEIISDETLSFAEIVEQLGLDPAQSFLNADLQGVDFGNADLSKFNLENAICSRDYNQEQNKDIRTGSKLDRSKSIPKNKAKQKQRLAFEVDEYIVYPTHGVGRIVGIEEQEVAGNKIEIFVINFEEDKMTLRVPTTRCESVGMRKLSNHSIVGKALDTLSSRARVKRAVWSRRVQEYERKINSGNLISIAEVVRDLYFSNSQPDYSHSEWQLYEAALDRMAREIAIVREIDEVMAVLIIGESLSTAFGSKRPKPAEETLVPKKFA